jgi:putative CocE/NonD family hydrolase
MYLIRKIISPVLFLCAASCMGHGDAEPVVAGANSPPAEFDLEQAIYLTMPDGIRLAADVYLPQQANIGETVPAMLQATRYWRSQELDPPKNDKNPVVQAFLDLGYAVVLLDVRGTGASFGYRETEFSLAETRDFPHVVDWIAKQPWSNGAVGALGYSYAGNTSENASFDKSPNLKAVVPLFTDFDLFTSILMPGGLKNNTIIVEWGNGTAAFDRNEAPPIGPENDIVGVKPVDEDADRKLLAEAVEDHKQNRGISEVFSNATYRDDICFARDLNDSTSCMVSPSNFRDLAVNNAVPSFHMGSWMDASTADGILARFAAGETPSLYVIGAWAHGATDDANPYSPTDAPANPSLEEQYAAIFDFLEQSMSDGNEPIEPKLIYFTMGENVWKRTLSWPPEGTTKQRLYFADEFRLVLEAPTSPVGVTSYAVNFDHGTGATSRWTTQLGGGDVDYGDRRNAAELLVNFTTEELQQDMEITGHPVIELAMSSTTADGAVIAYLQDVGPDGSVRLLTEGHLRLIHRRVSENTPPYPVAGPYHTFLRKDAADMPLNSIEQVGFSLLPTSVLIKKGHRIRISIAGHDKDVFERVPSQGHPTYQIEHNSVSMSFLELPIVDQEQDHESKRFLDVLQ